VTLTTVHASGVLQAVKELIAGLERKAEGEAGAEAAEGSSVAAEMPASSAFASIPRDVALARLQELKEDSLQAWSDSF
jgi:hypothetical protein